MSIPDSCALRSQLRGDPMIGTAFPAARLLLVEQPGPWGRGGLRDSSFDTEVATRLQARTGEAGIRVQAVRQFGRTPSGRTRRWAVVDTRAEHDPVRWGRFTRDDELLSLPLDGITGDADPGVFYLVCTHGSHDPCCARRGRPMTAALHAARPGSAWETSHLGGDRFGANVLVLPLGLQYGRVLPIAARDLADASDAGVVLPALLRGRIGIEPAAQAALAYAHGELGLPRYRDLLLVSVQAHDDTTRIVRLRGLDEDFDIRVVSEYRDASNLSCANAGPGRFLAHSAVSAEPASG